MTRKILHLVRGLHLFVGNNSKRIRNGGFSTPARPPAPDYDHDDNEIVSVRLLYLEFFVKAAMDFNFIKDLNIDKVRNLAEDA